MTGTFGDRPLGAEPHLGEEGADYFTDKVSGTYSAFAVHSWHVQFFFTGRLLVLRGREVEHSRFLPRSGD